MRICVIPARIGSKRIKKKNIINFFGKPLISYPITTALKSKLFDKVIVSTDSSIIKNIAEKYGALAPFLRPKELSGDNVADKDVLKHFLKYAKKEKMDIKYLCYLYPTATLMTDILLKKFYKILSKKKYGKLVNICKFPSNIERALIKNGNNKIRYKDEKYKFSRSQNLLTHYYDAGQCYWYKFKKNYSFESKEMPTFGYELQRDEFVDINDYLDLKLLKKIYKQNLLKKYE